MSLGKTKRRKRRQNKQPQQAKAALRANRAASQAAPKDPTWDEVAKFPLVMYNTLGRGIIIGFLAGTSKEVLRIYAPACIVELPPSNISFLPLFPVETFMDLRHACVFCSSPIPMILAKGYLGYFEQFRKGSYRMQPVVINGAIDAPEGAHTVSDAPEEPPSEEEPVIDPLEGPAPTPIPVDVAPVTVSPPLIIAAEAEDEESEAS